MRRYSPLLMILVLLGALAASQVAAATAAQPTPTTSGLLASSVLLGDTAPEAEEGEEDEAEEDEGAEVEFEVEEEVFLEECEASVEGVEFEEPAEQKEFEEEAAECEKEVKKGKGKSFVAAPEQCVVEHAESTIQTLPGSDRVLLTVHYMNYSAGAVAIGLRLKDHKGSLALERTTKRLGKGGTLHLTTKLGEAEMERAADAREFDVALRVPGTPGYCGDILEQHLTTTGAGPQAKGSDAHGSSRVFRAPGEKD